MRPLLAAVFLAAAGPLTATAADCPALQQACRAQCERGYPDPGDSGRAGCAARCDWEGATCTARQALDDTSAALQHDLKPWLADQAAKWQRFLDGFKAAPGGRPAEPPPARPEPGIAL